MAETLLKQTSSRTGYRDHLTETLNKARDFMEKEEPTEIDVVSINSIIEQLTRLMTRWKIMSEVLNRSEDHTKAYEPSLMFQMIISLL